MCDFRRPRCLRCTEDSHICKGYGKPPGTVGLFRAPDINAEQDISHQESLISIPPTKVHCAQLLPLALQASAFKSCYFDLGWRTLQPVGGEAITYGWLQDLPAVYDNDAALHNAFAAVSLACLGRKAGDRALIQQSHLAYGKALFRAKKQLSKPEAAASDEALGCVMVLALFETVHGSAAQKLPGMLAHMNGAYDLTRLRHPAQYATDTGRAVLRPIRYHDFFQALARRSRSFLAEEDWMELPWKDCVKSPEDSLVDVVARMPDLLTRSDQIQESIQTGTDLRELHNVEQAYIDAIERLDLIHARALKECFTGIASSWEERSAMFDAKKDRRFFAMFKTRLRYSNLARANVEIIYAAAQLIAHSAMLGVYHARTQASGSAKCCGISQGRCTIDPICNGSGCTDIRKLAFYAENTQKHLATVVRSLEFFLENNVLAASAATAPTMIAVATMRFSHDLRLDYVMELLKRYQKISGIPLADLVLECSGMRPILGANEFLQTYSKAIYGPLKGNIRTLASIFDQGVEDFDSGKTGSPLHDNADAYRGIGHSSGRKGSIPASIKETDGLRGELIIRQLRRRM
ncbi:hypothetical protein LTR62_005184 [Meristemomyces frigidus]|uniref:Zn(2)-C6 fungal-type domain-containing protein n=1 Tax=Meristemomyces frigidus TaxID=1508187 RepID=A0AAN7TDQ8_9PEZI|nr:hypothetical protein LTR62_005184 [Meristemomyces frigidus]